MNTSHTPDFLSSSFFRFFLLLKKWKVKKNNNKKNGRKRKEEICMKLLILYVKRSCEQREVSETHQNVINLYFAICVSCKCSWCTPNDWNFFHRLLIFCIIHIKYCAPLYPCKMEIIIFFFFFLRGRGMWDRMNNVA